ncbi:MAG: type II toxin-antitoxin system VapC family toxin [Balneolaceae bacterium]
MLIDSNIIIYAAQPGYNNLRDFLKTQNFVVSAISLVEVLGYHKLNPKEQMLLEQFFENVTVFPITESIIDEAIKVRKEHNLTLGDSLIAATCIYEELILVTRNVQDFAAIDSLEIINPID